MPPRKQIRQCDYCGQIQPQKLTSTYARWYPIGQESVGYALSLCDQCVEQYLVPAIATSWEATFEDTSCALCSEPGVTDWQYTWLTSFARGESAARFTTVACTSCMMHFRARFVAHGRKLEDRPREAKDPAEDYWLQLGIERRPAS